MPRDCTNLFLFLLNIISCGVADVTTETVWTRAGPHAMVTWTRALSCSSLLVCHWFAPTALQGWSNCPPHSEAQRGGLKPGLVLLLSRLRVCTLPAAPLSYPLPAWVTNVTMHWLQAPLDLCSVGRFPQSSQHCQEGPSGSTDDVSPSTGHHVQPLLFHLTLLLLTLSFNDARTTSSLDGLQGHLSYVTRMLSRNRKRLMQSLSKNI